MICNLERFCNISETNGHFRLCFCRRVALIEERFAKIYAQKMGVEKEKMMQRMWGDSFFNAKKKADENW